MRITHILRRLERLLRLSRDMAECGFPLRYALSRDWRSSFEAIRPGQLPRRVREPGGVIVDVGANVGDWAASAVRLLRPDRIICFEPTPTTAMALRARLASVTNAEVRELAVSSAEGSSRLECWPIGELNSLQSLDPAARALHGLQPGEASTEVLVPTSTLDAQLIGAPQIRLLQVDVQGAEYQVVCGATAVLQRTACVQIEVLLRPNYYSGATLCVELLDYIQRVSPLRLSQILIHGLSSDSIGLWGDAVLINEDLLA